MRTEKEKESAAEDRNKRLTVAQNRRARHEYEIIQTFDAGMVLVGTEVKSLRAGKVNIQDAFCRVEKGEVWVYNMHVSPFDLAYSFNVEPLRKRKLLLHHEEILEMDTQCKLKGLTLIPLHLYFQRGFAKIQISLAKGKKLYDKRESIAEKDRKREENRGQAERYK